MKTIIVLGVLCFHMACAATTGLGLDNVLEEELEEETDNQPRSPIVVLGEETTAFILDGIDSIATGELLFPGPLDANNLPDVTPLVTVATAAGNVVKAGGHLAQGALHFQAKLVAPLFLLGAKITAPIVKLKAKLAAPLFFAGAKLTKPLAKGALKLVAPALKTGQVLSKKFGPITKPFVDGLTDALNPITVATDSLSQAVNPVEIAVNLGFHGLNVQQEIDNTDVQADLDQLNSDAGNFVQEVIGLQAAGVRVAQQAAQDTIIGVSNILNNRDGGKGRKKRSLEEGEDYLDQSDDDEAHVEVVPEEEIENESFASVPQFEEIQQESIPQDNDDILSLIRPPQGIGTCEAYRSRLVTSQCHREEEYRTKTCSNLDCNALNIDAIHRRCQVSAPGVHCEQNCFQVLERNGDTCFHCNFRFTRSLSTTGQCSRWNDCLFGSRICPHFRSNVLETGDDNVTLQFVQQQQQQSQTRNKRYAPNF